MAEGTKIQWCDDTVNSTMGCDGCELWNHKEGEHAVKRCYAGVLHDRHGETNPGYSPTFDVLTQYPGRMPAAAAKPSLLGKKRPKKPWLDGQPRLFFVSDMSDALSRAISFEYLEQNVIDVVASPVEADKPVTLVDRHGGVWQQWPEDLRVRQTPDFRTSLP